MGGRVAARRRMRVAVLLGAALAASAMATESLAAQQRPARPGAEAADTLPPDSTLTPRERALQRLRALPRTPVQPAPEDTVPPDSAADIVVADSVAGPVPGDTAAGAPGADTLPAPARRGRPPGLPGGLGVADGARGEGAGGVDGVVREDSVLTLLRSLEGYVRTDYRGEAAVFRADSNQLRLSGKSMVGREGSSLETDSVLVYSGDRGVVCGYGNPVLTGDIDPVESNRVCYDIDRGMGEAVGARTKFVQGATWYVRGADNRVYLLTGREENKLYGERAEFTSCDLPEPHYVFRARSLKMVEGQMMVARNVTLEFEDVPVFWLPWMVQSMKRGRRSGLLMPEFGVNDIVRNGTGYNRHLSNLGFYWAINDYLGATTTFEWYSNNWTALESSLAYHWRRQFLQGQWAARQYWREGGRRDLTVNTSNSWRPDERTRMQLSGSYATSTDFVRRNSFDPQELNRKITSNGSVNRTFDWGSVTLGARRSQDITTNRTDLTLPSLQLQLRPLTLYSNDEGSLSLTWSGSGSADRTEIDLEETLSSGRDQELTKAAASHTLSFGRLSLSQSVDYQDEVLGFRRPAASPADSLFAPDDVPGEILLPEGTETLGWSTSLGYQQNLWTGTTLTPSFSIRGTQMRSDETGGSFVAAPNQISTGASLATTIFGFWPGVGRFSRIRHKISPSLNWQYQPAADVTAVQERFFNARDLREQNQLQLSFNQTFEAKVESDDTAAVDAESPVVGEAGAPGEPRRLPRAEKVMLLSINTTGPFVYDFVSAREEGRGFLTDRVSNSISSDLLKDLNLRTTHELWEYGEAPEDDEESEGGDTRPRTFSPFLTRLDASFKIDDDFWLFRLLGLTGREPRAADAGEGEAEGAEGVEDPLLAGGVGETAVPGGGSIVPGRGRGAVGTQRGIGGWQASLNYTLSRFRAAEGAAARESDQTLSGQMTFQPTEHWRLNWRTSYSFTTGEFSSHALSLTRDLHRWSANFDFVKAQNGNFMFNFRVELTDNPDLKLDYDQRTDPSSGLPQTGTRRSQ